MERLQTGHEPRLIHTSLEQTLQKVCPHGIKAEPFFLSMHTQHIQLQLPPPTPTTPSTLNNIVFPFLLIPINALGFFNQSHQCLYLRGTGTHVGCPQITLCCQRHCQVHSWAWCGYYLLAHQQWDAATVLCLILKAVIYGIATPADNNLLPLNCCFFFFFIFF